MFECITDALLQLNVVCAHTWNGDLLVHLLSERMYVWLFVHAAWSHRQQTTQLGCSINDYLIAVQKHTQSGWLRTT